MSITQVMEGCFVSTDVCLTSRKLDKCCFRKQEINREIIAGSLSFHIRCCCFSMTAGSPLSAPASWLPAASTSNSPVCWILHKSKNSNSIILVLAEGGKGSALCFPLCSSFFNLSYGKKDPGVKMEKAQAFWWQGCGRMEVCIFLQLLRETGIYKLSTGSWGGAIQVVSSVVGW